MGQTQLCLAVCTKRNKWVEGLGLAVRRRKARSLIRIFPFCRVAPSLRTASAFAGRIHATEVLSPRERLPAHIHSQGRAATLSQNMYVYIHARPATQTNAFVFVPGPSLLLRRFFLTPFFLVGPTIGNSLFSPHSLPLSSRCLWLEVTLLKFPRLSRQHAALRRNEFGTMHVFLCAISLD